MPYIHQHAHINYSFHQILELLTHTRWSRIVLSTQYFTDCGIRRCTCVCVCVCVCSDFLSKLSRVERERERERESVHAIPYPLTVSPYCVFVGSSM